MVGSRDSEGKSKSPQARFLFTIFLLEKQKKKWVGSRKVVGEHQPSACLRRTCPQPCWPQILFNLDQAKLNELLGEASLVDENKSAYSYKNPLPAGSYCLTDDVVIMASIVIKGNVTLDLNGRKLQKDKQALCGAIRVMGSDASLTLTDSNEERSSAIDSFQAGDATKLGGGVYVEGGTFVMTGGTIHGCRGEEMLPNQPL